MNNNFGQNPFQTNGGADYIGDQGRKWDYRDINAPAIAPGKAANAFISRVFTVMAMGLGITGLVSWLFATRYLGTIQDASQFFSGGMMWVVMLAPLVFVMVLSFGIHRLSYPVATAIFIAYASVMGISLSSIFFIYSMGTIFQVFLMTSVTFGLMALLGATTNIDLTRFGSILMFALIGLIVMSLVNWIFDSPLLHYIIGGAGVLIFAGLTAFDTQRLLRIGAQVQMGNESANKMALMGALSLYLDFVNLFLFLLRLFGGSRD
jgi:FtsH-binding integral membrane protein